MPSICFDDVSRALDPGGGTRSRVPKAEERTEDPAVLCRRPPSCQVPIRNPDGSVPALPSQFSYRDGKTQTSLSTCQAFHRVEKHTSAVSMPNGRKTTTHGENAQLIGRSPVVLSRHVQTERVKRLKKLQS